MREAAIIFGLVLGGCASASTIPLAADTVQITSTAAKVCGMAGAQKVALRQAASETINRGYDKFLIVNAQYQANTQFAGYTPVVAQSDGVANVNAVGNFATVTGSTTTTYTGGQPIFHTTHNEGLIVKMFKESDPAGSNAVSARETLGPDWQKLSKEQNLTCLD